VEPTAATTAGAVRGRWDEGVAAFLGVPFAAPPFGPNRLLAPAPAEPWHGVRDTVAYGPTAQRVAVEIPGGIPEPSIPGDDILNLNVFTPDPGAARLPVIVWIHGGGYSAGSHASPWYRGTRFARDGVVLVSIGYRLGAEGFMVIDGAPPNRAVLDWLAALEWVQDNIAAFGGDPGNVTLAGQSAGAGACTTLLTMPRARGLFARVLAMSGVARAGSLEDAEALARKIAAHLGVEPTREALAALDDGRLLDAQLAVAPTGLGSGGMPFTPVVDGDLVPDKPMRAIRAGAGAEVPLLAGTTREEFNEPVASAASAIDGEQLLPALRGLGLTDAQGRAMRELHAGASAADVLGQAVTDLTFRLPLVRLAEARDGAPGPTFVYEFRWRSPRRGGRLGAVHCVDLPFAFDNLDAPDAEATTGPDAPRELATAVHGAWVRFATDGDPGWPAHTTDRRTTMLFDVPHAVVDDPLRDERAVWDLG
jgi:para-nitrobenzyl esterase